MDKVQEQELLERAKRDFQAFGPLYDEYYGCIFGYALNRTANLQAAQDITSEVFTKALQNINRFHWRGIPFSAWLYRIANHEVVNHYRSNGHGMVLIEAVSKCEQLSDENLGSEIEAAEEALRRHNRYLAAQKHIARLPTKYQEVIVLRFFDGKSLVEIKNILGKKEATVKTLLYRGLDKLKQLMGEDNAVG